MKKLMSILAVSLACVLVIGCVLTAGADENTVVLTSPFTAAVAQVRDSVVGVANYQMRSSRSNDMYGYGFGFGWPYGYGWPGYGDSGRSSEPTEVLYGTGSGVVVAPGYILTNYHVVENASSLKITVDADTTCNAVVASFDEEQDLAVLYAPDVAVAPVQLGDSDKLVVGDWAIVIGNPLSETFSRTVTAGIISALDRSISSTTTDKYGRRGTVTNTLIQTDAAINNGNSGGGMFNTAGELIGIPCMKYSSRGYSTATVEGIGLCIPINTARPLIEEAMSKEIEAPAPSKASGNDLTGKPRMGITITNINTSSAAVSSGQLPNGVYVTGVDEQGPAAAAGMKAGDIIVDIDDTVITNVSQMQAILAEHVAGDTLKVKVYRAPGLDAPDNLTEIPDGEYVDLEVSLAVVDPVEQ